MWAGKKSWLIAPGIPDSLLTEAWRKVMIENEESGKELWQRAYGREVNDGFAHAASTASFLVFSS